MTHIMLTLLLLLPFFLVAQAGANTVSDFVAAELAKGKKPNGLINEKSPYLLQHAFNPVNWLPWGDEAFARAKSENKIIFLSIGYSTCHWCHVMAHESFEDEEVAAYLNKHFICIKVDREERPDIDRIYMTATQALTGSGGWPMSVFMLSDRQPFYAGTYFPPRSKYGRPGFLDVLQGLEQKWQDMPDKIAESAASMTSYLQSLGDISGSDLPESSLLKTAFSQAVRLFDPEYGGFGPAPKFPRPVTFNFLLRYHQRSGNNNALEMTTKTLRAMAEGGMYDILGGGFHRYSVDGQWRIPHFEKMLYDQGQLVVSLLEAFQVSGDPFFSRIARETLDYVLRDMKDRDGGFFSAEDADSQEPDNPAEHSEGAFYTWKKEEIDTVLGGDTAAIFHYRHGVKNGGNALDDPQQEFVGKNILYLEHTAADTAGTFHRTEKEIDSLMHDARGKLMGIRAKRPRPHLDDKVLTSWNGLMISAFAKGYQVLREPKYLEAAEGAADFILAKLYDPESGTLLRRYRKGDAGLSGQLDDYAFFIQGLIDLYQSSFQSRWLKAAIMLTEKQIELFWDKDNSGFFETSDQAEKLLVRMKDDYDGAEPAANSISAMNLLRLSHLGQEKWRDMAAQNMKTFGGKMKESPWGLLQMLCSLDAYHTQPRQVVIAGSPKDKSTQAMIQALHSRYQPNTLFLLADGGDHQRFLETKVPVLANLRPIDGKATAYVCENFSCKLPTTDVVELLELVSY